MSAAGPREIEIKLRLAGAEDGRRLLEAKGFHRVGETTLESDAVLDFEDRRLREARRLLRVRRRAGAGFLTYKGTPEPGPHKSREELEVELSDADLCVKMLSKLGLFVVFRYEKYRTQYAGPDRDGMVLLDETPIGVFLELEGKPEWIDRTSAGLGFSGADYITASYGRLYAEFRQRNPDSPADMLFT
jgi:adenylate cyclase class 2